MDGVARGGLGASHTFIVKSITQFMLIDFVLRNVGVYSVKKNYKSVKFCGLCLSVFYVEVTNQKLPMKKFKRNHLFIYCSRFIPSPPNQPFYKLLPVRKVDNL